MESQAKNVHQKIRYLKKDYQKRGLSKNLNKVNFIFSFELSPF